jgi:hypothetical protein
MSAQPSNKSRNRKEEEGLLTPPKTRLAEFSSAAAFKLTILLVMTPRLSIVTLLLSAASILSPRFHARNTAAAAPPKVECVET